MTNDEFLDACKARHYIVYRCTAKGCSFRGYGGNIFYHELVTKHDCMDEDSIQFRNAKFANENPIHSTSLKITK